MMKRTGATLKCWTWHERHEVTLRTNQGGRRACSRAGKVGTNSVEPGVDLAGTRLVLNLGRAEVRCCF